MAFSWNRFAYTNFHELNLDWFSEHFKEIFEEWEELYDSMLEWKADTDEEIQTLLNRSEQLLDVYQTWVDTTQQNTSDIANLRLAAIQLSNRIDAVTNGKLDKPTNTGTEGMTPVLQSDGTTKWATVLYDQAAIESAVDNWLNEHPEATTTVQDGSITEAKLSANLNLKIDAASIKNRLNLDFIGRTIKSGTYKSGQAFIARIESGTLYIYTCYYNYASGDSQRSVIEKMDISGNVIATSNALALDHSNDMCTDGEYIYVCGYNKTSLYKIDFATLSIVDTITLQHVTQCITYDYDNENFYGFSSDSSDNLHSIFKWNKTFTTCEIVGTYQPHYGVQTMEYYSDIIFFTENAPNSITAISTTTWTSICISTFLDFMSDFYPLGEMQGISFYNQYGDFVTIGKPRQKNFNNTNFEIGEGITAYGIGNIIKDTTYTKRYYQASTIDFNGTATVNNTEYVFKPLGTALAPFYNAGDLAICLDSPYYNPYIIGLESDLPDEFAVTGKSLYIEGQNHTIAKAMISGSYGALSNVTITTGTIQCSDFVLRNVSGNPSYALCNLNVISGTVPSSTTSVIVDKTDYEAMKANLPIGTDDKIIDVSSGSGTYAFTASNRPKYLLFCVIDSGVYSECQIIWLSALAGASIISTSYTASLNADKTSLTLTKTSASASLKARAYAMY